jgi:hypothetical protein
MDAPPNLRNGKGWRPSVWGLRVIVPGLSVVVVGLVALLWSTDTGQMILAVGMGIYLVAVVITVVGIFMIDVKAPPPRPNFSELRWSLLRDAVHVRSASAERRADTSIPFGEHQSQAPRVEDVRRSSHWRPAVWGIRVMGPGIAVLTAGLVTLPVLTSTGRVMLEVGIGTYFVGLEVTLVEVRRAYGDLQQPRPSHARVRQTLLHDPLHARS